MGHVFNLKTAQSSKYWHVGGNRLLLLTKNVLLKMWKKLGMPPPLIWTKSQRTATFFSMFFYEETFSAAESRDSQWQSSTAFWSKHEKLWSLWDSTLNHNKKIAKGYGYVHTDSDISWEGKVMGLGSIKFGIPALHRLPDTMFAKTTPSYHIRLKTSFDAKQSKWTFHFLLGSHKGRVWLPNRMNFRQSAKGGWHFQSKFL